MTDRINYNKLIIFILAVIFTVALSLCFAACADDSDDLQQLVEVTDVTLDESSLTLKVGENQKLTATVLPADASNKEVVWQSLNPAVATVENGVVTAVSEGVTSVFAVCGIKSASCIVTISKKPVDDLKPGITFDKTSLSLYIGERATINATVNIGGDGDKTLKWQSTDESVATVLNGLITAKTAGAAIIVATCGDYSASCVVAVVPIDATGVTLDKTAINVYIGDTVELKATVIPEDATNKAVLWQSLDSSVALVNNGRVTGVSEGSTVITVLCASSTAAATATCVVNVIDGAVTGLTFNKSEHSMYIGDTYTLIPTVLPEHAKDKTVIWQSSDESVATVANGVVTAVNEGDVTITGRAGEAEASCTFTISDPNPVTKIEVSGADSAFIDEFTLSSYELMTTRKNGEIGKFELKREYIADEDFAKLSVLGTHTLALSYKGVSGQWNIVIKNHEFEGIEFPSQTFFYDETPKSITVTGAPADTQIIYENNVHTDIGEYTATVTISKQYYNTKTLTATIKIELKERSVTYVLGYEDVTNDNPGKFNVMLGFTLVAPDRSEITDGKHFSGWFTDIEYIDRITEIAAGTDEDITLYAKWELPYTVNGSGAVRVTNFGKTLTEITVIPELNGIKVTAIGSYGFEGCTSLANITLPDGLTSIGACAFNNCTRLANITLPDGLTSIGESAFAYCEGLTGIILPERVELIENSTFRRCTSLANITLPDGLTSIGIYAFNNCTRLANITLPDGLTSIGAYAFSNCTSLANIKLPDSVTSIGDSAFEYCEGLTGIVLPERVELIENYTFRRCTSLASIIIPDGVTAIGDSAFSSCTSLASIIIPDSVTSIGEYAFSNCTSLANITLPKSVTSIGKYAFSSCTSLASIIIPDSVTSIGRNAFAYCEGLTGIILPEKVELIENSTFISCTSLASIIIPDGVTAIGDSAFEYCTSLANITLPDGLTSIGAYAFRRCTSLANITLPDGLISIGNSAFNDCTSLANITLPDGLISIGDSAFKYCYGLANIILPDSLTTIGSEAFLVFNSNWKSVVIPNNVTFIGVGAFSLGGLESITFKEGTGNGVYHIEGNCLIETATKTLVAGCNNSVIPKDGSVTIIGEKAFSYSRIKSITIPECVVKICKDAFHVRYGNFGLESVIFENPNWCYTNDDGEEIIIPSRYLEDPSLAASWLGGDRAEYEWKIIVK